MWERLATLDFWKPVFDAFVGGGVAATILFLWFKNRVKYEYQKRLEETKSKLNGELEGLRAGYQKILDENQIRFSQLHSDRADAIKTLYQKIADMEAAIGAVVAPLQHGGVDTQTEQKKAAAEAAEELRTYFSRNRIFFSRGDCDLIEKLQETAQKSFIDYTTYDGVQDMENKDRIKQRQSMYDAWNTMQTDFQDVRKSLEAEFQRTLGFTDENEVRGVS